MKLLLAFCITASTFASLDWQKTKITPNFQDGKYRKSWYVNENGQRSKILAMSADTYSRIETLDKGFEYSCDLQMSDYYLSSELESVKAVYAIDNCDQGDAVKKKKKK